MNKLERNKAIAVHPHTGPKHFGTATTRKIDNLCEKPRPFPTPLAETHTTMTQFMTKPGAQEDCQSAATAAASSLPRESPEKKYTAAQLCRRLKSRLNRTTKRRARPEEIALIVPRRQPEERGL